MVMKRPWYYWLELIARYEWPICAGLILCAFSFLFQTLTLRFLAILGRWHVHGLQYHHL